MNITFLAIAALLFLAMLALLAHPLLRRSATVSAASRQSLNTAIYSDQLSELERDRAAGSLSEADYEQSRSELQRRLLQDASETEAAPSISPSRRGWRSALALGLLLPVAAALLYAWLGNPAALQEQKHDVSAAQIEQMVAKLAARLEQNPDDIQGWAMLARSYKAMRRFEESEKAFAHVGSAMDNDPVLLTEYADLLAVKAGGKLEGRPLDLVKKALKIDPANTMALALAGTAAFDRSDFPVALQYWERLQKIFPPDSDDAKSIAAAIAETREKMGGKAKLATKAEAKPAAKAGTTVSGRVTLAPALAAKMQPADTLFVFARAVDGSRIPLAVLRVRAQDLPLTFILDDSMAMNPELKISGASQVKIEARISRSGNAIPQSGDLAGESVVVKPGAKDVSVVIERLLP